MKERERSRERGTGAEPGVCTYTPEMAWTPSGDSFGIFKNENIYFN